MKKNNIALIIQFTLCVLLVIVLIMSLFIKELNLLTKIITILLLVDMAYNNHVIYKRKYFTVIYLIAAILVGILVWKKDYI